MSVFTIWGSVRFTIPLTNPYSFILVHYVVHLEKKRKNNRGFGKNVGSIKWQSAVENEDLFVEDGRVKNEVQEYRRILDAIENRNMN